MAKKVGIQKYEENSGSYTDEYMESVIYNSPIHTLDDIYAFRPEKANADIGGGAWIMIKKKIPVDPMVQPEVWSIYWATPYTGGRAKDGYDDFGRYMVEVLVQHQMNSSKFEKVGAFPHEYFVVSEEHLEIYKEEGWSLVPLAFSTEGKEIDMELISRGRELTEEEREVILALQLDGLTETEACQEYFLGRHVVKENYNIMYRPSPKAKAEVIALFGEGV